MPACAWVRLDGRLHASFVQLLSLRLWSLLTQNPGSTAEQLGGMLCLLDECELQFLLHALTEEGVITAACDWGPPRAQPGQGLTDCDLQQRSSVLPVPPSASLSRRVAQEVEAQQAASFADAKSHGPGEPLATSRTPPTCSSVATYVLSVQTIYLPNSVEDVLPKFRPLLLPRLAGCSCGCNVLL